MPTAPRFWWKMTMGPTWCAWSMTVSPMESRLTWVPRDRRAHLRIAGRRPGTGSVPDRGGTPTRGASPQVPGPGKPGARPPARLDAGLSRLDRQRRGGGLVGTDGRTRPAARHLATCDHLGESPGKLLRI